LLKNYKNTRAIGKGLDKAKSENKQISNKFGYVSKCCG